MENQDQDNQYHEDEIDLRDYVNVIIKRKKEIISIFLIAIIISIVISFMLSPIYQASNLVKIGKNKNYLSKEKGFSYATLQEFEDIKSVFNTDTVLKQIRTKLQASTDFSEQSTTNDIKSMIEIANPNQGKQESQFIQIIGKSNTPTKAVSIVKVVTDILLTYHENMFAQAAKTLDTELRVIELDKAKIDKDKVKTTADLERLDQDIKKYEEEINKRNNAYSDGQGRIAQSYINLLAGAKNQKENKEAQLLTLEQKLISLEQDIQQKQHEKNYEVKPTEVEVEASLPETPISPKKQQNVMIGGILGLFAGIFYAFGSEYFKKEEE
ncbi:hypothetical protein ISS06_01935 [Patescibacteria group bacterium]|nr:hypothetical protein [Patescibacteria group bacterium]